MACDFMQTNLYAYSGTVLIAGACLGEREPKAFEELSARADGVYLLCPESTHINMAITKLAALLGTGQVTRILLATVDRSPHCVQIHFMPHEIERIMPEHIPVEQYVVCAGKIVQIRPETVERAKSLAQLENE